LPISHFGLASVSSTNTICTIAGSMMSGWRRCCPGIPTGCIQSARAETGLRRRRTSVELGSISGMDRIRAKLVHGGNDWPGRRGQVLMYQQSARAGPRICCSRDAGSVGSQNTESEAPNFISQCPDFDRILSIALARCRPALKIGATIGRGVIPLMLPPCEAESKEHRFGSQFPWVVQPSASACHNVEQLTSRDRRITSAPQMAAIARMKSPMYKTHSA